MQDSGERQDFGSAVREPDGDKLKTWLAFPLELATDEQPILKALFLNEIEKKILGRLNLFVKRMEKKHLRFIPLEDVMDTIVYVTELQKNNKSDFMLGVFKQYTEGVKKYGDRNWEQETENWDYCANYIKSAHRHFIKAVLGMEDENHWGALMFNLVGLYYFLSMQEPPF